MSLHPDTVQPAEDALLARIRRQRSWLEALREAERAVDAVERFESAWLEPQLYDAVRLRARFRDACRVAETALARMEAGACQK
jgi:hypothetical protein